MIDTTCPMCSRCNKVSKTHTNIECPCGCWYSPPQLSPTGDTSPSPGNTPIILTCPHCGKSLYH